MRFSCADDGRCLGAWARAAVVSANLGMASPARRRSSNSPPGREPERSDCEDHNQEDGCEVDAEAATAPSLQPLRIGVPPAHVPASHGRGSCAALVQQSRSDLAVSPIRTGHAPSTRACAGPPLPLVRMPERATVPACLRPECAKRPGTAMPLRDPVARATSWHHAGLRIVAVGTHEHDARHPGRIELHAAVPRRGSAWSVDAHHQPRGFVAPTRLDGARAAGHG